MTVPADPAFPTVNPDSVGYALAWLVGHRRKASTTAAYRSRMELFIDFCVLHHLLLPDPYEPVRIRLLPAVSSVLFCYYMAWLWRAAYAWNTIAGATTALRQYCLDQGRPDPTLLQDSEDTCPLYYTTRLSIKRHSDPGPLRYPITVLMMDDLTNTYDRRLLYDAELSDNLCACSLLLFFALLRVGECTNPTESAFNPQAHATRADITFVPTIQSPEYFIFKCKATKTDSGLRRGFEVKIFNSSRLKPVDSMRRLFLSQPQPPTSPLFDFRSAELRAAAKPAHASRSTFWRLTSRTLRLNGHNDRSSGGNITPHSFRSGGATALADTPGMTDLRIMQAGRWRSSCWKIYTWGSISSAREISEALGSAPRRAGDRWGYQPPISL